MAAKVTRILILDAEQRSALAAVRSLGNVPGVEIHAADSAPAALAGVSRHCNRYCRHPSPHTDPEAFGRWLIQYVHEAGIDFLLPMTEVTSRTALALREQLGECILPFAPFDVVLALSDKWRLIEMARALNVPCPASEYVANAARLLENLASSRPELPNLEARRFPLVVKPCLSRIRVGQRWVATSVHIAHTSAALRRLLDEKAYLREHPFILQEFVPGHGAGIFALYRQGEPVAFFAHRRLREKPPSGGVSVLSESVAVDPRLLDLSKKLLDAVQWHGVAMIEFRIDSQGTPYLMEVNTRFWGSLQLAIDAGVDFPRLLLEACIDPKHPASPIRPYRTGRRLRWLLGDFDNLYLTLKGSTSVAQKLSSLIRFFTPHPFATRHEINRWNDLKPAWFELKSYLRNLSKSS